MTLDLTTLEGSLKRDEELATRVPDPTAPCDLLDALLLMDQLCGALLARAKDCRELMRANKECGEAYGRDVSSMARERNAALERAEVAESSLAEAVRALEHLRPILANPEWGMIDYMEGSEVYSDLRNGLEIIDAALSFLQPRKDTP